MFDYSALAALAAVVREGSFERAAATLHVTPSAVSQRIKLLEERLGRVLIHRGQPCTATREGLLLCRHVERVGLLEQSVQAALPAISDQHSAVTLRIAVNGDSLATWFVRALAAFDQSHKTQKTHKAHTLFDLVIDDQDYTADLLRSGSVLAAVTTESEPVQGCRVTALGGLEYVATASPAFVRKYFRNGITAAALQRAPCITYNQKDTLQSAWIEAVIGHALTVPRHWLPSSHAFIDASIAGLGWGMNPTDLVHDRIKAGRLVQLHEQTVVTPLYWQCARLNIPLLEKLTKVVQTCAAAQLR
jgi:LysR family transcriptional regulator, chromosome initiation inhibitor